MTVCVTLCVCVWRCACVTVCARACVRACVRVCACVHACVRACVRAYLIGWCGCVRERESREMGDKTDTEKRRQTHREAKTDTQRSEDRHTEKRRQTHREATPFREPLQLLVRSRCHRPRSQLERLDVNRCLAVGLEQLLPSLVRRLKRRHCCRRLAGRRATGGESVLVPRHLLLGQHATEVGHLLALLDELQATLLQVLARAGTC